MDEQINKNSINFNEGYNNINNASNTFNLIIGVATLLIAILGATFAYFSAKATSDENDVTVKSAYVSISYDGGPEIKANNLIPSSLNVTLKKYQKEKYSVDEFGNSVIKPYDPNIDANEDGEPDGYFTDYDVYNSSSIDNDMINRKCVDSKGKEVCYVYQFSVISDGAVGEKTDIIASIEVNRNDFENLSYILYEVDFVYDNLGNVQKDKYGFGIVDINSENGGYQYLESNLKFEYSDKNPDNKEFLNIKFDKFPIPIKENIKGENGEVEVTTTNPVACLFGYKDNVDDFEADDTNRCASKKVDNKVKHTYQLLIWLEETGKTQDEQDKKFEGTVAIDVNGGIDTGEYGNGEITGQE